MPRSPARRTTQAAVFRTVADITKSGIKEGTNVSSRKLVISLAAVAIVCWATGMILEATDNEDLLIAKLLFFGWAVPLLVLVGLAAVALARSARRRNA
ncbi:MAG: hypothetical protein ICV69_12095 [Thermoleophilaceae bacterium]|nr:hypothetical protein [Thermoleophilaceae bacterium]